MADLTLNSYADLKTAALHWLDRVADEDVEPAVGLYIKLAEQTLNRELRAVETDALLTATAGSKEISLSSLAVVRPLELFLTVNGDEELVTQQPDGSFPYDGTSGQPEFWSTDGNNAKIVFNRPCDLAYPVRFSYVERFALSDSVTTNWLLTNHGDLYLAATLFTGFNALQDNENAGKWGQLMSAGISSVRNELAAAKRGELTVDPGLAVIGTRRYGVRYE